MDLLEERLPEPTLTPDVDVSTFFDRCEAIAHSHGWVIDRRREYAGPGYDQLNIHLSSVDPGYPMVRMVASPRKPAQLSLDVVSSWTEHPIGYDEYIAVLRDSYAQLLDAYKLAHGKRLRLGMPHRPARLDAATMDCNRIRYAAEKLGGLARTLAVGEGDARGRLISAFSTFHVIRPADLPEPLKGHMQDISTRLHGSLLVTVWRGPLRQTVRTMKNVTAAAVLEHLLDIADAVQRLERMCDDRRTSG